MTKVISHHPARFLLSWLSCLHKCTVCSRLNPYRGVWYFPVRVAGFKQISIEPPRSSVHHVEEEGEGFCEYQKWNQEIGPKVLNSHPRLLNCPECTLLPKVMIFLFILNFCFIFLRYGGGSPVLSGKVRRETVAMWNAISGYRWVASHIFDLCDASRVSIDFSCQWNDEH